jgi:hypothetical protein
MDRMKKHFYTVLIIALTAFYAILVFRVFHPQVSLAYRQYFLTQAQPAAAGMPIQSASQTG